MSLWVDSFRPTELSKLSYHLEMSEKLKKMVDKGNFPHLLFYGAPGSGKKTRIMCLLREVYGSGVEKVFWEFFSFIFSLKSDILVLKS